MIFAVLISGTIVNFLSSGKYLLESDVICQPICLLCIINY